MSAINYDAPVKVMIENLSRFVKFDDVWNYKLDEENSFSINVNKVIIQGEICKFSGFLNEILIINDGTAKAKVTRGNQVPGDFSWVQSGVHCSVVGFLLDNGKLPHIAAVKVAKITNPILQSMWPLEVMELKDLILNKISFKLTED